MGSIFSSSKVIKESEYSSQQSQSDNKANEPYNIIPSFEAPNCTSSNTSNTPNSPTTENFDNDDVDPNSTTVSAYLYKRMVYDSVSDYIHGGGVFIVEMFIPSAKVCMNFHINQLNIFEATQPPGKISDRKKIQITREVCNEIKRISDMKKQVDKEVKKLKKKVVGPYLPGKHK